ENTTEIGAANKFFATALRLSDRSSPDRIDETKPEALLDYVEVLLKLRNYGAALNVVDYFESEYWSNERSQTLRIKAYIAARQFEEAEEALAKKQSDDPNTIKLNLALVQSKIRQVQRAVAQKQAQEGLGVIFRKAPGVEKEGVESQAAELKSYRDTLAELVRKLLPIEPNSIEEAPVVAVCNNYVVEGKVSEAKELVDRFLEYFPANVTAMFYKQILSEPEPNKVSQQRRKEIEEQVLLGIDNPIERSL
ncbi:unnamed protein product, partial [marine sediment metagenome]